VPEGAQTVALARPQVRKALLFVRDYAATLAVAGVVFAVAYDNGGYGESTRDALAIALWWVLILAIAFGLWPLVRTPLEAWICGGLLGGLGLLTLLSTIWASDASSAFAEFNRISLYVGAFAVAVAASNRDNAGQWINGLALGIVGVAVVSLVSRLFPHTFSNEAIANLLPSAKNRLAFPLGYWNGLAVLLAMGIPLLLRLAVAGRNTVVRGIALAPIPALAGAIYLASSRTGVVVALAAIAVFLLLTGERWTALAAIVVAAVGSLATTLALAARDTLVNGPIQSATAESQGRSAALIIAGVCVLTGLVYALGRHYLSGRVRPHPALGWGLLAAAIALVAVGLALAHPVRRFHEFKKPTLEPAATLQRHLLSGSGNGRWQLWDSALKEFESKPLIGRGAGSYQQWWLQHGSLPLYVQSAHSLYLQTLGELGIIGFLLLAGAFIAGLAAAAMRVIRASAADRITLAAVTSAFAAFALAAGVDWMWELTIVTVVGIVCLGLAVGPASALAARPRTVQSGEDSPSQAAGRRFGVGVVVIGMGWLLICSLAISLLAGMRIRDSQDAAARGDSHEAISEALDARSIQPWSPSPYLQLALLEEVNGNLAVARRWLQKAIDRDPKAYDLWAVAARIDTRQGQLGKARMELARAKSLYPRSPLFARG
jgi:tetratricopeptide (TPR) repeat protein